MYFEKKFESSVWKVVSDTARGHLGLELRNKQFQQVAYGYIDLERNAYQKLPSIFPDKEQNWWTGLLDLHKGIMLVHGYENAGLPLHKGLFAYHLETSSILWSNSEVLVKQNGEEGILLQDGSCLDWQSGEAIKVEAFHPLELGRASQRHHPSIFLADSRPLSIGKKSSIISFQAHPLSN